MTETSCVCVFVYMYINTKTVDMYVCVCAYTHTHKHTSMYVCVCIHAVYILDFIVFQFSSSFSSRGCAQLTTNILVWWMKLRLSVSYIGETLECPCGELPLYTNSKGGNMALIGKAPAGTPDSPATAAWGDVGCPSVAAWLISCH